MLKIVIFLSILMALAFFVESCHSQEIDVERLADAIYKAENSTAHPYGIMTRYKTTTPRQACINTIKSALRRFAGQTKETDFIHFLSLTYCPIGAANDPTGLNVHWAKNTRYWYDRSGRRS